MTKAIYKTEHLIWGSQFQRVLESVPIMEEEHGSRNGARAVTESSHLIHKLEAVIQLVWH